MGLTRLYVLSDRQRPGIGRGLLDAALAECAEEGFVRFRLVDYRRAIAPASGLGPDA